MKRNLFISFFILAFANNLFAQNPLVKQWDKRYGGTRNELFSMFQQTNDGGFILAGTSISNATGDKSQFNRDTSSNKDNRGDYWIIKIDSSGTKLWDKRYGGSYVETLSSIEKTNDNGFILCGVSFSDSSGDKTENLYDTGIDNGDFWIVKIDSIGNKQWDKDFGGNFTDNPYCIIQTQDGGYLCGGYSWSDSSGTKSQNTFNGSTDFWLVKMDSLGNKQWDKDFGGNGVSILFSIAQSIDGGYLLGGSSDADSSGDKSQPTWGGVFDDDYWILKIDSAGNKLWDKDIGGMSNDALFRIKPMNDGNFILGGTTLSGIGGNKTQSSKGEYDFWIVKIDTIGNIIWERGFGGSLMEDFDCIEQTSDGGFLMSGDSYSPISGDKSEDNLGVVQSWILKTDANGNKQWDKTLFTNDINAEPIVIQSNDGCFVIANFTNADTGGYKTEPTRGGYDYWIIKFCDTTSTFIPSINLSSSDTSFCEKQCINFTDLSTNSPASWQWSFPGADSTTSNLQNPTNICYSNFGSYDVTLIACNAAGCDTLVLHNFINEYQNPVDSIWGLNDTLFSLPAYSYQWYEVTGGLITGATNQFYIPTQLGSYFCVISDSIGCIATSNTIIITAVQSEIYNSQFAISPNPFNNLLTITVNNNQPCEITLYDITSRKLLKQTFTNSITINTQQLAKGIYLYEVRNKDEVIGKGKVVND